MRAVAHLDQQLEKLYGVLDSLRAFIPVVQRSVLEKVFDSQLSRILRMSDSSAFTPILADTDIDRLLPVQYMAGLITPTHYMSATDPAVGFYIMSPRRTAEDQPIVPIGVQFLPYGRHVLHVQGLHLDSEGMVSQYTPGSLYEDHYTLSPLPIYTYLKQSIEAFATDDTSIGKRNAALKNLALEDILKAEKK